jgi:hypothetical protein
MLILDYMCEMLANIQFVIIYSSISYVKTKNYGLS